MITRYTHDHVEWLDLESPTEADIETVASEFNLDTIIATDLRVPTGRTKIESHPNYIYIVLHLADHKGEHQEIDFVLGKNFLITAHYQPVNSIYTFSKLFETHTLKRHHDAHPNAGHLFQSLIIHLYHELETLVDILHEDIERSEQGIFSGRERNMVKELSKLSRRIISYRLALKPHAEIWDLFEDSGVRLFGASYGRHSTGIEAAAQKIWNMLESGQEAISALRETNDSLLTAKTNETLIHLSMMAFVIFPLTLIAGIFGMNTTNLPFIGHPNDFWIIIGIMFISAVCIFSFFKIRKWL